MGTLLDRAKELTMYFHNIFRLYSKIWKLDKMYIVNTVFIIAVKAVHPFNSIIFLKLIVDELTASARWTHALLYILLMCLIELTLRAIDGVFWTYEQKKILHFKTMFLQEINRKTMSLSYHQIEDPQIMDDRQKAMEIFYPGQAHFMDLKNTIIDSKQLISNTFQFVGVIGILVTLEPSIFAILLLTYVVSVILNTIAADKEFNVWSHSLVNIGRRIGYFQELSTDFAYAKEMRINQLGQWIVDKMNYYFHHMKKDVTKAVNSFTIMGIVSNTLQVIVNGSVYLFIGWLAFTEVISLAEVVVYISSLGVFASALSGISSCIISLQKAGMHLSAYFHYVHTVSSHEPDPADTEAAGIELDAEQLEIELINVWFKYPQQEHYTIKNLNLTILPHEKLAIVGENGAGKTTLIKLLLRLYQPSKGQILMNGIDINRIRFDSYMKLVTAVFQDFNILQFSLRENIVFDCEAKEADVSESISSLGLGNTIDQLPQGIHTELGRLFTQEGIELSGGQQQKLAIARALYKNSPFIILDEPTAMLSPKGEYDIYSNFAGLTKDKTTVYISHRMSSCRFCHRIAVMRAGELVELGNHEQLMREQGEYYTLYTTQAEFYRSLESQPS
ncbi:ABC transporter ATP-binding protein/permease [Paenibacillus thiaminolyticus]|uniref:ABC transporter ATP-binding protein/permease n=1 Tax=Paenibacillus thiaminolyticus TaxID=49283 RepID=A0ABT4FQL5_PANTH|nr:ABC transporter ATP-binding protein [Paenibacillus thiaminolyticus]MCY9534498.1 ABC transporter ATP-binding protein/permease [Paenibacillus thiaminolyticus]MCY9601308.1 ABC transporter ATP-binding protein/permease [Paenibacillus thiaminolyticus]MCY9606462.1 ABC transporter ATP-binding protein/permease [Paenibacillus thiaminolyticus]MCY9614062.1 ABC transporter ATP-binding protein/permease [Paenibacillus thiaminolyticus]MCY9618599.1 ABC transporter ATP-binding protein/permease [Paenibacillus